MEIEMHIGPKLRMGETRRSLQRKSFPSLLSAVPQMMLSRRSAIGFSALLVSTSIADFRYALGATGKTIDRRVRSENRAYGLTFAAEAPSQDSIFGHAFIVWQREDDAKNMSTADAIGFYPKGEPNDLQVIFGTTGTLETDVATMADLKLTVLVNSDVYQQALQQKAQWMPNGTYSLLWSNCTSHVADIAKAIGLKTSSGSFETPKKYISDLMKNNN